MSFALVENREHLDALARHCEAPSQTECWLYDAQLLSETESLGFRTRLLSEKDLKEECNEISAWARDKALNLFNDDFLQQNFTFHGVNLLDACSHFTSYALSWLVGCYRLFDLHLAQNTSSVYLFDRPEEICLNSILLCIARDRRIEAKIIRLPPAPALKCSLKERLRDGLGKVFSALNRFRPYVQESFIFCGGLRHLSPLILHQKGRHPFMLLEDLFQGLQFSYCMKNEIRYSLLNEWSGSDEDQEARVFGAKISQLRSLSEKVVREKGLLDYKGKKMPGIETLLFEKIFKHFPRCLRDILIARKIAQKIRPRAVILDDDTNTKRAFALSLRQCNVALFVTAHGELGLSYRVPSESSHASIGEMFVNSSYSKAKYGSAGWDENKLIITGLPQYDRIVKLRETRSKTPPAARRKVLYCPHYMALNSIKSQRPFEDSLRAGDKGTLLNNEAVLHAIESVDCDLWIKFYRDETYAWKKFLKTFKVKKNIRFFHHSEDIFKLLNNCDVLISGDVSTVILEGMMFDKPVLSLNFSGFDDVHPYPKEGMVLGVYRPADLVAALKTCLYNEAYLNALHQRREQRMNFYWSGGDGQGAERVWRTILERTGLNF